MDVRFEYDPDARGWAAVLLRDGEPWFLDGALVGMGRYPDEAVKELDGIVRHLVTHGRNFLTPTLLSLEDRKWLWEQIDPQQLDNLMWGLIRNLEASKERTR